jgi:ribosomal protein S9
MNDQMPDFEPPAPMFEDPKPKKERKKPAKKRARRAIPVRQDRSGPIRLGMAKKRRKMKKARKLAPGDKRLKANRKPVEQPAGQQTISDAVYSVLATLIGMEKADRDMVFVEIKRLFR